VSAKEPSLNVVNVKMRLTDRVRIREEMLGHWMKEKPGTDKLRNLYRYNVETLADGSCIYLMRPARLNKGCDFVIYCENFLKFKNGNPKPPQQRTLIDELDALTSISPQHKVEILTALRRVWDCENVDVVVANLNHFKGNIQAERALKLAMWLFIEQDVTYWTESGRQMIREWMEERFGHLP